LEISSLAKQQVKKYKTLHFYIGLATHGKKTEDGFEITTQIGDKFSAKKLIFASGVKDHMPNIPGFADCWGISVIHCPYCHGYEVKNETTGILANGDMAYHIARLINHWTKDLYVFTNGTANLTQEQQNQLANHNIPIVEKEIAQLIHKNGRLEHILFKDQSSFELKAIYARPAMEQHCKIPASLGCELNENGLLKVDFLQKTNIENVYACGDNTSPMRSIAYAVATGNIVGAVVNNSLIDATF